MIRRKSCFNDSFSAVKELFLHRGLTDLSLANHPGPMCMRLEKYPLGQVVTGFIWFLVINVKLFPEQPIWGFLTIEYTWVRMVSGVCVSRIPVNNGAAGQCSPTFKRFFQT